MSVLRHKALARHLALAYLGLIVYASLYPFSGWHASGLSPLAFLEGGWPRYWTLFDLAVNVAAYLPLGFLLTLALPGRLLAALLAIVLAGALSLGMEAVQGWLPNRVPSSLDLACNAAGGLLGALLALFLGPGIFARIAAWETRLLAPTPRAEAGLTLLGLWLFTQLSPETVLFGTGDLRRLFGDFAAIPYRAEHLFMLEAAVVASNTLAAGLLARQLISRQVFALPPLFLFFVVALAVRALSTAIVVEPAAAFAWLTPSSTRGLVIGGALLALVAWLPDGPRLALASLGLLVGTVAVNLAPESPYRLAAWPQGHFLNFNGLTRLVSVLWPFLALPYLTMLARPRER